MLSTVSIEIGLPRLWGSFPNPERLCPKLKSNQTKLFPTYILNLHQHTWPAWWSIGHNPFMENKRKKVPPLAVRIFLTSRCKRERTSGVENI